MAFIQSSLLFLGLLHCRGVDPTRLVRGVVFVETRLSLFVSSRGVVLVETIVFVAFVSQSEFGVRSNPIQPKASFAVRSNPIQPKVCDAITNLTPKSCDVTLGAIGRNVLVIEDVFHRTKGRGRKRLGPKIGGIDLSTTYSGQNYNF